MNQNININTETIDSLRELLEDDFGQLIDTYISDTQSRVSTLKSAIDAGNVEEVANQAHAIKGSSRNLGIDEISNVSGELESQARDDNTENFVQFQQDIEQYFAAAKDYLEQLI